ncbi:unnamed protein product [Cladocopium goreaui]|uniref:Uncharacterized protein n=1 Tax=Cladocopium goreaui TaxID=2562237 RepID=A0A9P1C8H3_9DINO|nr:unnamed protein product [Cladocopium goreaui]
MAKADLGSQPVLLSNGNGWANVTRFATLSLHRLSETQHKAKMSGASALWRCVSRIEEEQKRSSLHRLRQSASMESVLSTKKQTDEMLRKLRVMVDSFDLEVDESVESICRHILDEEDDLMNLFLKH